MSDQLSLIDASHVVASTDHPQMFGDDITSDIEAVVSRIPRFGGTKNTARAGRMRVLAYLYARTDLGTPQEQTAVRRICGACTRTSPSWQGEQLLARLNGEPWDGRGYGDSRSPVVEVSKRHGDARWMLEFRHSGNDDNERAVERMVEQVRPGLLACGVGVSSKRLLLPALAPLVLALRWSDHVAAAVYLAGSGVAPKSLEWEGLVDMSLARGQSWAVKLAELSARHPRDALSRALAWVHAR